MIVREDAPPPVATALFRLTPRGEQLRPLLDELFRWGLPLMTEQPPADAVRSHWLAGALELMLTDRGPASARDTRARTPAISRSSGGARRGDRHPPGSGRAPDATLTGPARPIMGLLLGLLDRAGAKASGVDFAGDATVLERLGTPA